MMRRRALTVAAAINAITMVLATSSAARAADLASARALYASASYEDALKMIATLEATEGVEPLNQLRALCLLALGRTADAEGAIERVVLYNPTYEFEASEMSPRVATWFRDVRQRTLPVAARAIYTRGKTAYDEKRWTDAQQAFTSLIELTTKVKPPPEQAAVFADLRQLGEGFLSITGAHLADEQRQAEEERAAQAAAARAAADAGQPASLLGSSPGTGTAGTTGTTGTVTTANPRNSNRGATLEPDIPVFTTLDRDVRPPIEQRRTIPPWTALNRLIANSPPTGLLEIVIDETGAVIFAEMVKSITPSYDAILLQSARTWRYMPARKANKPVRYRQVLEIVVRPTP